MILMDFLLYFATWRYIQSSNRLIRCPQESTVIFSLVCLNTGLVMVDHIHFQYNGMLLAFLVLILDLANRAQYVHAAAVYSALVLFKHLFAPLGKHNKNIFIFLFVFLK